MAETIAAPIEQQVNGVENMLYMSSQSASDGSYALTITFKLGTNLDTAQVLVQNRVNLALPILPEEVRRTGVQVNKQSSSMILCVNLISPDDTRDELYLNNYAILQVKDTLARVEGVGAINIFGSEYSMRIWLDPNKLASLGLTASDVVQAIQEQNRQVAAGIVGQQPAPKGTQFQINVSAQGRLVDPEEFSRIVVKRGERGEVVRLSELGSVEIGAKSYAVSSNSGRQAFRHAGGLPTSREQRSFYGRRDSQDDGPAQAGFSAGRRLSDRLRHDGFRQRVNLGGSAHFDRSRRAGCDRGDVVSANLAGGDYSTHCRAGFSYRDICRDGGVRILPEYDFAFRPRSGDRHRGRRCDRGCRGHRT